MNPRKLRHKIKYTVVLETDIFNIKTAAGLSHTSIYGSLYSPIPLSTGWALSQHLENLLHPLSTLFPSDSVESAQREIGFFFPEFCVEEWMRKEEPFFRSGQIHYDYQKLTHTLLPHSWPQICCCSHNDWGLFAQYTEQLLHVMYDLALQLSVIMNH